MESQLCQRRDELAKEKQLVKTLRSSVENAHLDVTLTEHRLQEERRGQAALVNWAFSVTGKHRRIGDSFPSRTSGSMHSLSTTTS